MQHDRDLGEGSSGQKQSLLENVTVTLVSALIVTVHVWSPTSSVHPVAEVACQ